MRHFPATPRELVISLWRNRELIKVSAWREVLGRYRGSVLGILWSFFNPLFLLSIYTFVFSEVLKARWGTGGGSKTEFALVLFAGLMIFNLFAECINRAPHTILSNVNYVKKVVFPLEILPFITLISALFHAVISLCVWLVAYILFFGLPSLTAFYLPLIILPFCFFIMGLSWALASLGVFLRDVSQFIGVITTMLMFMSPIFFPATAFPEEYRHLLYLNPLTPAIEQTRDVMLWGKTPDFMMLGIYWVVTIIIAWLGFAWFQKTRKGFSDVL
ncbi:ABC transporter permease [Pseudomonas paraveronii]|uniref:ABC transporter permease n=1 Tax=Pseudomonas paraveronii TaxID=3040598 RepID=UPI002AB31771|nr:ABC transporter permease [Pseudomonas sp. FLM 11]